MSDTPRTDNCLTEILDAFGYVHQGNCPQRWVNHGRELERELNAANDRIQSLIEERDRANRLAEWKWNLRDEFELLLGTSNIEEGIEAVKELKRRIKRLEEAGDALCENSDPTRWDLPEANARKLGEQEAWRKAKEAKP